MPGSRQTPATALTAPSSELAAIAILPFTNLSESLDQQYFGDAIANDIIIALTRFRWFRLSLATRASPSGTQVWVFEI
jgi:TolB-like protein